MKFYIHTQIKTGLFNDISVLDDIYEYLEQEEYSTFLYGNTGVYWINKNKFIKVQVVDKPVFRVENYINDTPLLIDDSYVKKEREETICLPINHVKKTIKKQIYSLSKFSLIKLVFEIDVDVGRIKDFYFITNESYTNEFIKDDISTFLSLIK